MSFIDKLWLQNNLKENLIIRIFLKEGEKRELRIETWNQKLGLQDTVGLVFIIAFLALIITT